MAEQKKPTQKQIIAELNERLEVATETLEEVEEKNVSLEEENEMLKAKIATLEANGCHSRCEGKTSGLKSFEEMYKIDMTPYIKTLKSGAEYVNWAIIFKLLHENGAKDVSFTPITHFNPITGEESSLFKTEKTFTDSKGNTNSCYEVAIKIKIDDMEWEQRGPLVTGGAPVKDHWVTQQVIWNAQTRLFVKGVAMKTGLGFSLWTREETNEEDNSVFVEDINNHDIMMISERMGRLITEKQQMGFTNEDMARVCGMELAEFQAIFAQYNKLNKIEGIIRSLGIKNNDGGES